MNIRKIIKKTFKRKSPSPKYFKTKNYKSFDKFWVQKVTVKNIDNRLDFFKERCANKDVLHFGCTDWPIFRPEKNLHIQLAKVAKLIHGFDVDLEGIENLKKYVNQKYFSDYINIENHKYDVCLIPETIEHVDNVKTFLENISKVNADTFLITAPNCFTEVHINRNYRDKNHFIEVVHPDHNCWYSPYTLKNQIEKYSNLEVKNTYLLNKGMMICCEAVKKSSS
ncbi:hypothetical protein L3X37_11375 [Sabulilitoribacter arenilitoris]|uniref:Methyltransferase domain-containing protein n=1 Tax=Wocania arenilitoris TaxID=2044858 RepID=A0AAE3JL74_9FLAO|nr:methyltransferase domain-containing protein [Wocania arenilitoris]MCF7568958.1 hypothetical protein [Wocania arenilitoris]